MLFLTNYAGFCHQLFSIQIWIDMMLCRQKTFVPPILILQWGLLVIIEFKKIENQFRLIFSSLTAIKFFSIVYLVLFTELNFLTYFLFQCKNFTLFFFFWKNWLIVLNIFRLFCSAPLSQQVLHSLLAPRTVKSRWATCGWIVENLNLIKIKLINPLQFVLL